MRFTTLAEPVYIFVWFSTIAGPVSRGLLPLQDIAYRVISYPSGTCISCDLQTERDVYVVWFGLLYRVIYPRPTFIIIVWFGLPHRVVCPSRACTV